MKIKVLSLFDGCSCGRLALERAGIQIDKYYTSEIDKYSASVARRHYSDNVELGDITKIPNDILDEGFDLVIGGSPCQGFSFAGKQMNFEDPRSKLYFDFERILKRINPKYWLLENVVMKKEWSDIISSRLGTVPVMIDSALVSAQTRKRLYWTNIKFDPLHDKGILLKDIIFDDVSLPALHNIHGGYKETEPRTFFDKSPTLRTASGGGHIPSLILTNKALQYMDRKTKDGRTHWDFKHHSNIDNAKSSTVVANFKKGVPYNVLVDKKCIRNFHPIECERLQTMPDNYTMYGMASDGPVLCYGSRLRQLTKISNTQRYNMIGNGWTIDVLAHIFKGLKK